MSLALNKPKLDNLAGDIWKSAERLRGKFKAYEYQNVVLPIIVIRRLECVLIKWREDKAAEVLAKRPKLSPKELAKLVKGLEINTAPFSNKTDWTLRKVYEEDPTLLEDNFRAYINGFSKNVDDIIEHFNYRSTIGQMVKNNCLGPILNQYKEMELGPDKLSPLEMGYIYEELLRRFSEQSGEEAGEHGRRDGGEGEKTLTLTLAPGDNAAQKFKELMEDKPEVLGVEWTHRHYVEDDEYIPHGEDIEAFLKREIVKPIIRWKDSPQLGYEILPNKYFYRYQPPTPAKDLLEEFWRLEKEAESLLKGLAE